MSAIDDPIYRRFMARQMEEGMELARSSDILRLRAIPIAPPTWVADFYCKGLVRDDSGEISEGGPFSFGIWFPPDYLRRQTVWFNHA